MKALSAGVMSDLGASFLLQRSCSHTICSEGMLRPWVKCKRTRRALQQLPENSRLPCNLVVVQRLLGMRTYRCDDIKIHEKVDEKMKYQRAIQFLMSLQILHVR